MYMKQYSRQTVREGTQAVKVGALGRVGESTNGALKIRNNFWCAENNVQIVMALPITVTAI